MAGKGLEGFANSPAPDGEGSDDAEGDGSEEEGGGLEMGMGMRRKVG